jgi:hypothetical protein
VIHTLAADDVRHLADSGNQAAIEGDVIAGRERRHPSRQPGTADVADLRYVIRARTSLI